MGEYPQISCRGKVPVRRERLCVLARNCLCCIVMISHAMITRKKTPARSCRRNLTRMIEMLQVSRLVIDLSDGISNQEFVRMHTLIYKLCTIPQVPV